MPSADAWVSARFLWGGGGGPFFTFFSFLGGGGGALFFGGGGVGGGAGVATREAPIAQLKSQASTINT